MPSAVKFVLNRGAFRDQILRGGFTTEMLELAARAAAPSRARVEVDEAGPRSRARVYGRIFDEASSGELSQALGRMRV